jgi:excisionase family DNA binding protein
VPLWPDGAEVLGVGRSTAFELARSGELETVTVGRKRMVARAALNAFVKARRSAGRLERPSPKKPKASKESQSAPAPAIAPKSSTRRGRYEARGQRMWDELHEAVLGENGLVMLDEACRIADRLDKLDALLEGDADVWSRLELDDFTGNVVLVITAPLVEARQQANALRQLLLALPLKPQGTGDEEDGDGWAGDM